MRQQISHRKGWRTVPVALVLSALLTACGSSGGSDGGGSGTVTAQNNVALGPVSGAAIVVKDLTGNVVGTGSSATYSADVDLDENQSLLPFARQQVGKFTVTLSSSVGADDMLLVSASGGTDIDPDDDGNVSSSAFETVGGTLYAYATASDLINGRVTVNAFTTLAALFVMHEGLESRSEISAVLADIAALLYGGGSTALTAFNPADLDSDGKMTDVSLLADAAVYAEVMASPTLQAIYAGTTPTLADSDGEGLFNDLELMLGSSDASTNTDGDALNDYGELYAGTDPAVSDTDAHRDTLYSYQWHLNNTGQDAGSDTGGTPGNDINVAAAWEAFAGKRSILVGVVDTGVEATHPDLTFNLDLTKSYRYSDGSNDPSPDSAQLADTPYEAAHGTACAGLIAAQGWNGLGVRGVAPFTKVAGYNVFSTGYESDFLDALGRSVDVSSNSWGYGSEALVSDPTMVSVFEAGVQEGRGGKGTVYVFAAGNDRSTCVDVDGNVTSCSSGNTYSIGNANNADILNNPYVITVAAVDADGHYASYSNYGANILVAAPGGEYGYYYPAIVTTDLTGLVYGFESTGFANVYRLGRLFDVPGNENGDYTNYMNGTSSATPIVGGVAALMFSANPSLTYRDVRYILATTAVKNDPSNGDWTLNGAGYHINPNYGFGMVDATAAVAKAEGFTSLGTEKVSSVASASPALSIPDNSTTGVSSSVTVGSAITVEHVDVNVTISGHTFLGDLDIVLVSPDGTESRLAYGGNYYVTGSYDNWHFSTERCLDENAAGQWTLKVRDLASGDTGTLKSWSLQVRGR